MRTLWRRSRVPKALLACAITVGACAGVDAQNARESDSGIDTVVLSATRIPSLIADEPLRIEAVPAEEIEENLTVQPGNLSSLLNELPSIRVQSASPSLGGDGLQLRGMPTRHTLVLSDGLPLLGSVPDAFGLLQTPPLDLARIEVIKGAASALYGGSALGGVLNVVSQTPQAEAAVLANANSRGARDVVAFLPESGRGPWSGTLTVGAHDQSRQDVNSDGWSDLAGYRRYTLRPRLWWAQGEAHSLFLTLGVTNEYRDGGTLPGAVLPDGNSFPVALHTRRLDGGAVSHVTLDSSLAADGRMSFTRSDLDQTFGARRVDSVQTNLFAEQALSGDQLGHQWALGVGFQHQELRVPAITGVGYSYNVPAVFAQDEFSPATWVKLAAAARLESNNAYGTFLSPRLSSLWRNPGSPWSLRTSVAGGYAAPNPFVDEIEATGLGALLPPSALHAERAVTESVDGKWASGSWDVNASVFNSEIHDPLQVIPVGDRFQLANAPGARRAPGAEVLIRFLSGPLQMIGSWSYINASELAPSGLRQAAPLVPRHSAELSGILESEKRGRIGLEIVYTGTQGLEDDPYRMLSHPYVELNALAEIRFAQFSIFLNAINFTDTRQTRFDPLLRRTLGPGGDPITDVWASLAGRIINVGIRTGL